LPSLPLPAAGAAKVQLLGSTTTKPLVALAAGAEPDRGPAGPGRGTGWGRKGELMCVRSVTMAE
jgi:hypothetical protein